MKKTFRSKNFRTCLYFQRFIPPSPHCIRFCCHEFSYLLFYLWCIFCSSILSFKLFFLNLAGQLWRLISISISIVYYGPFIFIVIKSNKRPTSTACTQTVTHNYTCLHFITTFWNSWYKHRLILPFKYRHSNIDTTYQLLKFHQLYACLEIKQGCLCLQLFKFSCHYWESLRFKNYI